MWRVEIYFPATKENPKKIQLQKDLALPKQAKELAIWARDLGLGVLVFEVNYKQVTINEL